MKEKKRKSRVAIHIDTSEMSTRKARKLVKQARDLFKSGQVRILGL